MPSNPLAGDVNGPRNDDDATTARADSAAQYDCVVVVHYDDAPDECTIYPADAVDDELMTTWVSAQEGSFVSLDEMR